MAGVEWRAVTGEITTGTIKFTALQLVAAANHRVYVKKIDVSFKGVVVTDAPVLVRIVKQTDAGTSSALTLYKGNASDDETLQITGRFTSTADPTTTDLEDSAEVHPQGGRWRFGPFWIPGGGRLGVEVTSGVSTSIVCSAAGEE